MVHDLVATPIPASTRMQDVNAIDAHKVEAVNEHFFQHVLQVTADQGTSEWFISRIGKVTSRRAHAVLMQTRTSEAAVLQV